MVNTNESIILYYDLLDDKKHITVKDYKDLVAKKDKDKLAKFVYNRLYSRYIKPFEYDEGTYINKYKNSFSMMASFCLLIETLQCFKEGLKNTDGKSKETFKNFFKDNDIFTEFKDKGEVIYKNIRCGILHQGETTGGWILRRNLKENEDETSSFKNKIINADEFMENMKQSLEKYRDKLEDENWGDKLWKNFCTKMEQIIENTK
ncbi:hypothetical protein [Aliarcobacter butzleri]|uniref:hypothetical protein n=1 Tax=Aliarcobacter butzleri TaxID=28197 RepID=UPI00263D8093|nr:hypothetical protein [Aliarcobacter butzleri]MDN5088684.1 hypothetical protein [Aliarcobacter butzleri]